MSSLSWCVVLRAVVASWVVVVGNVVFCLLDVVVVVVVVVASPPVVVPSLSAEWLVGTRGCAITVVAVAPFP